MIDVQRDDLVIMMEAGYVYLAMRKFQEAKEIFEGVSILAKKHDIPQVGLANTYFAQSKFLESVRILKNAVKETPASAFAWAHLGESLLFHGKYDDARQALQKASELDAKGSSGEFAKSLLQLMDQGYDPVQLRKEFKQKLQDAKAKQPKA